MAAIEIDGVGKVYAGGVRALSDISLHINDGEFIVLVGPSGCGKTTLLRSIAGLEEVTEGAIRIGGRDVTMLSPQRRDVAMVFQNYALYPSMTVRDNLAFGLKMRKTQKEEAKRRVDEVARILGLSELLDRKPGALSGGQRQRVAIGRAMVREPQAYLMDEPLSNLDAKLRVDMRAELARLHERLRVTTVYVTHDQVEATTLGQRVAVLRGGALEQCDTPQRLFDNPANLFVAGFIGSPAMNLVDAEVRDGYAWFGEHSLPLRFAERLPKRVILGIRPTDIELAGPDDRPRISVVADVVEDLGSESLLIFSVDAPIVSTDDTPKADHGDEGYLLADEQRSKFRARITGRYRVAVGDRVDLAIDDRHLHFFDAETALPIAHVPMLVQR